MPDHADRQLGFVERLVLRIWRWLPGACRERHGAELASTLARAARARRSRRRAAGHGEADPASRAPGIDRDPAGTLHGPGGVGLLIDALTTLVRAWTAEVLGPGHRPTADRARRSHRRWRALLAGLGQDIRHALRLVRRAPGFASVVVVVLGLGIGGATTFFSVIDGVILTPLPYRHAERPVDLREHRIDRSVPPPGTPGGGVSYPNYLDLRRQADVFESMGLMAWTSSLLLGADEAREVSVGATEPELFRLLGVEAALGRTLREDDRGVVVLSDPLWRTAFGSDPEIVGRSISLGRRPSVVVGVMPAGFRANWLPELWIPLADFADPRLEHRGWKNRRVVARLADGVDLETARAALQGVAGRLATEHPEENERWSLWASPLHAEVVGDVGETLWMLLGTAGVLLLIACANVANLQLARLSSRRREMAVRRALGAGRGRIARQLLAENVLLGLLGGALGLLLAHWGTRAFISLSPGDIPRLDQVGVDGSVFGFATALSVLTGVAFGSVPTQQFSRLGSAEALRSGGSGAGSGARRLRNGLLVAELALAVLLTIGAALTAHSFLYLWSYEPGFEPEGVLTLRPGFDRERYPTLDDQHRFYLVAHDLLEALPQVEAVGGTNRLPVGSLDFVGSVIPDDRPDEQITARLRPVSGDYLDALRVPLVAGRPLRVDERMSVLLNQTAARDIWPELNPAAIVGRRLRFPPIRNLPEEQQPDRPWLEIVGIVGDVRHAGLAPAPEPEVYVAQPAMGFSGVYYVVVRTAGEPLEALPAVRDTLRRLDPEMPIDMFRTMEQVIADSMARPRFYAFLLSAFGALALILSAAGVFGVAAYTVMQRHHEIGVRMALGARPATVVHLVLGQGMKIVVLGIGLGVVATRYVTRYVESFLHGVSSTDATTFAVVCATFLVVAAAALGVAARRATRVDPVRVLRDP